MPAQWLHRWGWFVGLWIAGVLVVTAVGLVIRLFLVP